MLLRSSEENGIRASHTTSTSNQSGDWNGISKMTGPFAVVLPASSLPSCSATDFRCSGAMACATASPRMTGMGSLLKPRSIVDQPFCGTPHLVEVRLADVERLVSQLGAPVSIDRDRFANRLAQSLSVVSRQGPGGRSVPLQYASPSDQRM